MEINYLNFRRMKLLSNLLIFGLNSRPTKLYRVPATGHETPPSMGSTGAPPPTRTRPPTPPTSLPTLPTY